MEEDQGHAVQSGRGRLMKFFLDHVGSSDWTVRRRIIILSLIWIAGLVTYLAIWGRPTSLVEAIATNLILLFGGIVGSYVFGAVWDSNRKRSADLAEAAIDQSTTVTTDVEVKP